MKEYYIGLDIHKDPGLYCSLRQSESTFKLKIRQ
jgi:hypothetical protein